MLRTLRNRLVFSHILPIIIIIPLMGLVILYALENQVLLPRLSRELEGEARLLAIVTSTQPRIWDDSAYAQELLAKAKPELATRVMILDPQGHLMASSDPLDGDRIGTKLDIPDLGEIAHGEAIAFVKDSQRLNAEIVDAYAPVIAADRATLGIVRLSYRFVTVYEEYMQLRLVLAFILVVGMIAGVLLGSTLALNINSPLQKTIRAVDNLASGTQREHLTERGPEEMRRLLRAVNFLMDRLHNLEEARHRLLANLVHEIGRPLGALHAALQALLLTRPKDSQVVEEMLVSMSEETKRLQRLLDDLSHLQDQVLGTFGLEKQPVRLGAWLAEVLAPWETAALEKRLHWETDLPADLPVVQADPLRLAQAVGNLTSNAIKYTPSGGEVTVAAGMAQAGVWIKVSDNGPGISASELENIFTPFYRGAQGGRTSPGMGLGLSIARDLIIAHEGRLEVESQPGIGSQFTLWLPPQSILSPHS